MTKTTRRTLLATLSAGTLLGLAGCSSDGNDDQRDDRTATDTTDGGTATPGSTTSTEATTPDGGGRTAEVHRNALAWPSRRADPGNSGRSTVATAPASPPAETWSFSPPNASGLGAVEYVPAVADGTVYAPSHPDIETFGVYALDPATGESEWTVERALDEGRQSGVIGNFGSAAVDDSTVYATDRGGVLAVSRDGSERWTSDALLATPRTMNDGVYGLGAPRGDDLGVVGLEGESGAVRTYWQSSGFPTGVAFDADRAYVLESPSGSDTFDVVAVSLSDATEVWRTAVNDHGEGVYPRFPVVNRNTVLVSRGPVTGGDGVSQGVVAVDADSGRERWSIAVGPDADSNVGRIVTAEGRAHVVERFARERDAVRAYDLADGSLVWETTFDTDIGLGDGGFATGDTLYVPGFPTVALSLADGTERWRDEEGTNAPLAVGAGNFYRPGANGLRAHRS